MLSLNDEVALWSTHCICLSLLVKEPENVASKVQLAPALVDLKERMIRFVCVESMPIVVVQAVPSEVHSTVGSDSKESPVCSGSSVLPQLVPPLVEKYCPCWPLELMLFEAPIICWVLLRLTRIIDSLRAEVWAPEMRCSPVSLAALKIGPPPGACWPGWRSWWESIHS